MWEDWESSPPLSLDDAGHDTWTSCSNNSPAPLVQSGGPQGAKGGWGKPALTVVYKSREPPPPPLYECVKPF